MKMPFDTAALVLALLLSGRVPDATERAELTWYDPARGGINCDVECEYMGHDTPVAGWYGRALACPVEYARGTVFRIDGRYWRCLDAGGAVVRRADGVIVLDLLMREPIPRRIVPVDIFLPSGVIMKNTFAGALKSSKFWASAVGMGVVVASGLSDGNLQLNEGELLALVTTVVGYVIGTAVEDSGKKA